MKIPNVHTARTGSRICGRILKDEVYARFVGGEVNLHCALNAGGRGKRSSPDSSWQSRALLLDLM